MIDEQLEFEISQYADGTLRAGRRAALESQIAADPELARLLDEYVRLGSAFESAPPMQAIDFDRLAMHLSDCVAEREAIEQHVPIYQMPWVRRAAGLAVAACLAIVIGVGLEHRDKPSVPVGAGQQGGQLPQQLAVAGPSSEAPTGAVVSEITVGPSPAVAMDDSAWRYGDSGVVAQQQRVVIASSDAPVQDTPATPY